MATTKSTTRKPVTSTAPVLDAAYRLVDRFANTASMQADTLRIEAMRFTTVHSHNEESLNKGILMLLEEISKVADYLDDIEAYLGQLESECNDLRGLKTLQLV